MTLAWATGLIDGEGTIRISRSRGTHRKTPSYQVSVSVALTHHGAVLLLQKLFGGGFTRGKTRSSKHRNAFRWIVSDDSAVGLLKLVKLFLVVKRKQAELAIRFREQCPPVLGIRGVPMNSRLVDRRDKFYWRMRELNLRGDRRLNPDSWRGRRWATLSEADALGVSAS